MIFHFAMLNIVKLPEGKSNRQSSRLARGGINPPNWWASVLGLPHCWGNLSMIIMKHDEMHWNASLCQQGIFSNSRIFSVSGEVELPLAWHLTAPWSSTLSHGLVGKMAGTTWNTPDFMGKTMVLWYLTWISCGFLWAFPSKSSSHGFPVTRTSLRALQGFGSGVSPWWKTCTACDGPQMMWPVPLRIIWNVFFWGKIWENQFCHQILVGGLEHFLFFHILGMSSSQLTKFFLPPNIMGNFMHIFLRTLPRLKRRGTEVLTAAGKADAWWATLAMMEARGTINTFFGGKSYENGWFGVSPFQETSIWFHIIYHVLSYIYT